MKLLKYIFAFLPSFLCQAVEPSLTPTSPTEKPLRAEENMTTLHEKTQCGLYIHHLAGKCNWTVRMSGNGSGDVVPLTADYADSLVKHICQDTGCGNFYTVENSSLIQNATCFHSCAYADQRLQNCSESESSNCTVIGAVVCENQAVRLSGGPDRCAGRVELLRDGRWGTVCDDQWDLTDAGVVCEQLGCGYALNVTGQGGAFPAGRGPVYRDELNCTGQEKNLWACPASQDESDCGHKEDAGVVCSEMRAVRLTGGLDRCSGKVEIHRNGTWGTVCDNCWNADMATAVCSMLQCGPGLQQFSRFLPPLELNKESLYYYDCDPKPQSLWQCSEIINSPFLCTTSKASGVICQGSLGFPNATATTPTATEVTNWTTVEVSAAEEMSLLSLELLIAITVSLLLLVLLITNTVLCCHYRRRHAFLLQQTRPNGKSSFGSHQNHHSDTVDLVKVTTNAHQADDSQRYRTDNAYSVPSALNCLSEEDYEPPNEEASASACYDGGAAPSQHVRQSMVSADSFETSSTSSGECYENVTISHSQNEDDEDEDHDYSPVSPE
ncbi:deleted in malignant brain tumors 1 protein-like isoform X1 [Salarias fasciatus]|uniref:deleted in malignant brain tumors 1 protein-like isoform X1 n=1 Tax=Salarias fasciatus TaxID=181472 RepID=UPI0011769DDA|nr:deleted in malignant brain tumors 1 protein-like isoform X1 [Salarias fasciatus]